MEHNEGREPTDAAAEAIEALRQRFDRWWHEVGSGIAPGVLEEWSEHAERVARAAWVDGAFLSGTRPLPDTAGEVAQPAEFPVGWNEMPPEDVLRAEAKVSGWMREHRIKEWALGHSASRDMVAALRAEVARLKDALIDREIERNQLLAGMQEELTAQRLLERCGCLYLGNGVEVAISGTTARVAELEAELAERREIVSDWVADISQRDDGAVFWDATADHERSWVNYGELRKLMELDSNAAPGKEPTDA